jgi:hypothetical protein
MGRFWPGGREAMMSGLSAKSKWPHDDFTILQSRGLGWLDATTRLAKISSQQPCERVDLFLVQRACDVGRP